MKLTEIKISLFAFAWLALCSGCVTVSPEPVQASQQTSLSFSLEADTVFEDILAGDYKAEILLAKGEYRLAYSDRSGQYFLGPEGALQERNFAGDGRTVRRNGGLWLPSNKGKSPKLFTFIGEPSTEDMKMGLAVYYLGKLEAGRIKKIPGGLRADALSAIKYSR